MVFPVEVPLWLGVGIAVEEESLCCAFLNPARLLLIFGLSVLGEVPVSGGQHLHRVHQGLRSTPGLCQRERRGAVQ